jgi:hypothetical protein
MAGTMADDAALLHRDAGALSTAHSKSYILKGGLRIRRDYFAF